MDNQGDSGKEEEGEERKLKPTVRILSRIQILDCTC